MKPLNVLLIEPFYSGSHKSWADAIAQYSSHNVELLTLPGRFWKWRMHGAALSLAKAICAKKKYYDVIMASDMLDLALLKAMIPGDVYGVLALYFHESQFTYPRQKGDKDLKKGRDRHYSWINYTAACVADVVFWNSQFHLDSFLKAVPSFLKRFPDHREDYTENIREKSHVLYVGLNLEGIRAIEPPKREGKALLLWNHRWEYDKNPLLFFETLFELKRRGIWFELAVLGQGHKHESEIFKLAREKLQEEIVYWGYVDSRTDYIKWLLRADILPVTSYQEFFGISVLEAVAANTIPLLPRRLVYPEHFNEDWQQRQFFYDDPDHLIDKLQRFIMDIKLLRTQKTDHLANKYDWKKLIAEYDDQFKRISLKK